MTFLRLNYSKLAQLINKRLYLLTVSIVLSFFAMGADTNVATSTLTLGVSEVSLLKTSSSTVSLTLGQQDAGMSVVPSKSDSTARLLISSVITSTQRTISAKITTGTVPAATVLKLVALQPNATFVGSTGTLGSQVTLDGIDRTIVTGIGTCYSGTSTSSDGYPLKFTYAIDSNTSNYSSLRASTGTQIIVTLTLTAAAN
jgi:hypothetical protein